MFGGLVRRILDLAPQVVQHLGARSVSHDVIDEVHEWNHLTIHILGSALRSKRNCLAIDSVTILGIPTDIESLSGIETGRRPPKS